MPHLTLVTVSAADTDPLAKYRGTVVRFPFPDRHGRVVLMSIDQNGRVFDQGTAETAYEVQMLTDRMMRDLGAL